MLQFNVYHFIECWFGEDVCVWEGGGRGERGVNNFKTPLR